MLRQFFIIVVAASFSVPTFAGKLSCSQVLDKTLQQVKTYLTDYRFIFAPAKPGEIYSVDYMGFLTPRKTGNGYKLSPLKGISHTLLDVPAHAIGSLLFKDDRKAATPVKLLAGAAFLSFAYYPYMDYLQKTTMEENVQRNMQVYTDDILYDVRFQDLKSKLESGDETKQQGLVEAFLREQSLQSYYKDYLPKAKKITSIAQVMDLVRYPQFSYLRRLLDEKDLDLPTWDELIQLNNNFYRQLKNLDNPSALDSSVKNDPFYLKIMEQSISAERQLYALHQWLYWQKTFKELEIIGERKNLKLTMSEVEAYLFDVAQGKIDIPQSLESLMGK